MTNSQYAWTNVWKSVKSKGEYAFRDARLERAQDKIDHFLQLGVKFYPNESVLEAGCGDGAVIISLQKKFLVNGYGVDFAEPAKLQAKDLMDKEHSPFNFNVADIQDMSFADSFFDKLVCLGVIEHMDDQEKPLKELLRVLKPGGTAIIMTPSKLSAGVIDRKIKQLLGSWNMGYQTEFSPSQLGKLLRKSGFSNVRSYAVMRKSLPHDSISRKCVSVIDKLLKNIFTDWGFYSYTIATKE